MFIFYIGIIFIVTFFLTIVWSFFFIQKLIVTEHKSGSYLKLDNFNKLVSKRKRRSFLKNDEYCGMKRGTLDRKDNHALPLMFDDEQKVV